MKPSRIRINNIEFRPFKNKENYKYLGEFVYYKENPYYQHEADFVQCELNPDYYYSPDGNPCCKIHKSCFANPESCYVIAELTREDEPDIRSIGDRPWTLDEIDERDFKTVVLMTYERIYKSES